jgi:opacity protein-like surface antigen
MSKALYPAIAVAFAASACPAVAADVSLTCTLRSGNTVPLTITGKKVLKGGRALSNFEPKSFISGTTYIRFNQSFDTYSNAWSINRNNLQVTFKTILKADSRVVLEENGSCASAAAASLQAEKKPAAGTGLSSTIAAMFRR